MDEIAQANQQIPNKFFERLVKERLDSVLQTYIHEIDYSYDTIENSLTFRDITKVMRRLNQ